MGKKSFFIDFLYFFAKLSEKGVKMLEQMGRIFSEEFNKYGLESLGYFIMALCLGMFFLRSTQKRRFHFISAGCYVLAIGGALQVVLPTLVVLNPHFLLSPKAYQWLQAFMISITDGFLWSSLFVSSLGMSGLLSVSFAVFALQMGFLYFCFLFLPDYNVALLLLAFSWVVMGISFHFLQTAGKTSLFNIVGDSCFVLAFYYLSKEWGFLPEKGVFPLIIFGGVSVAVLMAQIKFMETACLGLEATLSQEKERRTLFWDIAPFPILVSKLLDDSVLYINPRARAVLKVEKEEIPHFHLKDYFTMPKKRDELIELARQKKIVDSFEVKMKSPKTGDMTWLDISARVVELDGELALYMNLQDITGQKETEEKLFKEASTDALTGLYNRRQFEAMSGMALANCIRQKTPYAMMMLDIDHFKHVNDTYGHDMGDVVLQRVADVLNKNRRESDIVARFGGEEFIVFLNNTDVKGALVAAERIRSAVEKAVIMAGDTQVPITISLGISATQNGDIFAMTKEADIALYHSKENGRNQVSVFTEEMREEVPQS